MAKYNSNIWRQIEIRHHWLWHLPWRLHSWSNQICRLRWRTSSVYRHMAELRSTYQNVICFKEILLCCIDLFLSLCVYIQRFLFCQEFSSHEKTAFVYPSLDLVHAPASSLLEDDSSPFSETYEICDQPCKPNEIKDDEVPLEHASLPSRSQLRYKPLKMPPVVHEFPPK